VARGECGEAAALADCYRNSLALAEAHALRSIAFPAISCGVYGFPPEAAARIAVETAVPPGRPGTIDEIVLAAFDQRMASLLSETLGQMETARQTARPLSAVGAAHRPRRPRRMHCTSCRPQGVGDSQASPSM
jgi:hypothetical protein